MTKVYKSINKVLFLGNGINRLVKGVSWSELMKELGSTAGEGIPFPLQFEQVLQAGAGHSFLDVLKAKKTLISQKVRVFQTNGMLAKFVRLPTYTDILTTNYDYNIECELVDDFWTRKKELRMDAHEDLLSMRRGYRLDDKRVWHIHGEACSEKNRAEGSLHYESESILIGFNHYALYLQSLMNRLKWFVKPVNDGTPFNAQLSEALDTKEEERAPFWMFKFFTDDIDLLGFSLDTCETHLWWLLSRRAELQKETRRQRNRIRFFDIGTEKSSKHELLRTLGVEVVPIAVENDDYRAAYERVYRMLAENNEAKIHF